MDWSWNEEADYASAVLPSDTFSRLCALAFIAVAGCGQPPAPGPTGANWFSDVTATAGLEFVHQVTTSGRFEFSEIMGSGAALLDFDNDGRLDVFLIHNVSREASARNRLYQQLPDGRFTDVTTGSGLEVGGRGNGVAVGDLDNDGQPEVLITEYDRIRLFHNRGRGKFADITESVGLTNPFWSVPAAFVDFDRDGWLDLVVGNYLDDDPTQRCLDARGRPDFCGPQGFRPTITRLFRNLGRPPGGDAPRFADVTVQSGLFRSPGKAMQIVCADFDGDRWPDLFVTDDALPNRLFVNQRNGTFTEEAVTRGLAYTGMGLPAANMGIALGDVDDNGWFDLFVPHLTEENHTLWRQTARGLFQDWTAPAGLMNIPWHGTGFGAVFADFDSNGTLDLAVINGRIRRPVDGSRTFKPGAGVAEFWQPYVEPAQLFSNAGDGRFTEVSGANPSFCAEAFVGRGLILGDLDNDGGLDLLTTGIAGPARLFRNTAVRGHWLGVRAIDPTAGGRDAYGAEVVVQAGGRRFWRLVQPAFSYASSHDPRAHFGLGATATVESIEVRWPDGTDESFNAEGINRYLTLRKGGGTAIQP